jgi:hypothetical protein
LEYSVRTRSLLTAATTAALLVLPAGIASADSDGAQVTVIHGVPGLTVDVYINGDLTLEDFEPGTVTDELTLPAGSYDVEIYAADAVPADGDPAIAGSATVTDGLNASIIAHLDADGAPTLGVFVNDITPVTAGDARLTVRHTAAAPAVDILAGGAPLFESVTNPNEGVVDVAAGDYDVAVNVAGTDTEVEAVPGFTLAEGVNTIVYAVGDAGDAGTFELLVQTVSGLHSSPDGVPAGSAGLASDNSGIALTGAALLLLAGAAVGTRRRVTLDA